MSVDFAKSGFVPDSVTVFNNVQVRVGGPDHIVAQLRIEVEEDGKQYSLQTGSVNPGDTKGLFYAYDKANKYKLVIEVNHVTTWTSTQWNVLLSEDLIDGGYTFVVDGTPEDVVLRKFRK